MKVKKQKRHRKTLTFYTACHGFRKPFKVLCDGTFVHHLLVNRIPPADMALGNILSATVKHYTTRCVLAELKRLGRSYSKALEAARKLIIARYLACLSYLASEMLFSLNLPLHFSKNMSKLLEYQIFRDMAINKLAGEGAENSIADIMEKEDLELGDQIASVQTVKRNIGLRSHMSIKDKPQFKRKKSKGSKPTFVQEEENSCK